MPTVATRLKGLLCRSHDLLDENVPDSHQILDGHDINATEDTIVRDRVRPGILLASMGENSLFFRYSRCGTPGDRVSVDVYNLGPWILQFH